MTQRVLDGLGLPAGLYRLNVSGGNPTFYAPNGITADQVDSIILANVLPVTGGYDMVVYDGTSGVFVPAGSPNPSSTDFNLEALAFADDVLRQLFLGAHPEGRFPYSLETSESRANIVGDLAELEADFTLA